MVTVALACGVQHKVYGFSNEQYLQQKLVSGLREVIGNDSLTSIEMSAAVMLLSHCDIFYGFLFCLL